MMNKCSVPTEEYAHFKRALLDSKELEYFNGEAWVKKHKDDTWSFLFAPERYRIVGEAVCI